MRLRNLLLIVVLVLDAAGAAYAQGVVESAGSAEGTRPAASALPITRVVLFSSGVGFFQRTGKVTGDEVVELPMPSSSANDLLQSLVVSDGGNGKVTSIDYSSQDPLSRALKSFPVDLSDRPGVAQILSRARGAEVRVPGPQPYTGVILGVESRKVPDGSSEKPFLDLLTADGGIRSVDLSSTEEIRFLDAKLAESFKQALALIAANRSTDTKRFALRLAGSGTRPVSVSYLIETPVWKTSYRLSVAEGKPTFLQGWAIVDNPTDEDWTRVALDLVSGQPISFRMDLSQPIYNRRPVVPVPLPPSVTPQVYEGGIGGARQAGTAVPSRAPEARSAPAPRAASKAISPSLGAGGAMGQERAPFSLGQGVESAVEAAAVGTAFRYSIKAPVTLPRHQSAMVPIVNQEIEGKRVAIYDESVLANHPLSGLQLVNTTGLHLAAGPVTVFEEGVFAGDAQIGEVPPGSTRLISYGVDLQTTVVASGSTSPEEITSVRIVRGSMIVTRTLERQRSYEISSTAAAPRTILVEYPVSAGWKLLEPKKPTERTTDHYRFAVVTDPKRGGRSSLTVREQRVVSQSLVLSNLDSRTILLYLGNRKVSEQVKRVLTTLNRLKSELADLTGQQHIIQADINSIYRDQERIRSNMRVLKADSALYKRYAATLGEQEDRLTASRQKLQLLTSQVEAAKKRIEEFLGSLGEVD